MSQPVIVIRSTDAENQFATAHRAGVYYILAPPVQAFACGRHCRGFHDRAAVPALLKACFDRGFQQVASISGWSTDAVIHRPRSSGFIAHICAKVTNEGLYNFAKLCSTS
jgi:hypothetical protein